MLNSQLSTSRRTMIALLVVIGLILLTFTGLFAKKSPDLIHPPVDPVALTATTTQQNALPVQLPGAGTPAQLQLSGSHTIVYAQQNMLYRVSTPDGTPQTITAPGYTYNRSVPPILLANNQLLYGGKGVWITSIFSGAEPARQIAPVSDDQVMTSLVLAANGRDIAWSTAPANGQGAVRVYVGSLEAGDKAGNSPSQVYQSTTASCPCFRVFSLIDTGQASGQRTLLLSNNYGDHQAVGYNLWSLTAVPGVNGEPKPLLANNPPQIPLAQAGGTLLSSTSNGVVPFPTDSSAPDDIAALNYANGLVLSALNDSASVLSTPQTVLPTQRDIPNFSDYHWVMSPRFAPDGQALVYVQFSSDAQVPFGRHSSLYTVHLNGKGATIQADKPQVLVTASARFVELGPWLNDSILTFYADNAIYAIDIHTGATARLTRLTGYGNIIAAIGS